MMKRVSIGIVCFLLFILFFSLRIYNLNWDSGFHMHPDERAIILSVIELEYPTSVSDFFNTESLWNPKFFAYGSFPFYLLRLMGDFAGTFHPPFAEYDGINLVGRFLSALFDVGTIFLLFLLGGKLRNRTVGVLAATFYGLSTLAIQLSHFYAVDTPLTFFTTLTLYLLLHFYEKPTLKKGIAIGVTLGLALGTKISALVLLASLGVALSVDFWLLFLKQPTRLRHWAPHLSKLTKHLLMYGFIVFLTLLTVFFIVEPYAFIDFPTFLKQTLEQSAMTKDAFTFPYTLQYVGKVSYLYELTNIYLYGLGPILGSVAIMGTIYTTLTAVTKSQRELWQKEVILLTFFWVYFLLVGQFAIGFMRYMLPIYPLFALFGALFIFAVAEKIKNYIPFPLFALCALLFALSVILWPMSFVQIYSQTNPRLQATAWILKNIPPESTVSIEHWDDAIPIQGQENYIMQTLELYNPDTPEKWAILSEQLSQTDYLILASNRLSTPLSKLTDCANLPAYRCYPQSAEYYRKLVSGENVLPPEFTGNRDIRFKKVAEFTSFPTLPFTKIHLNDQTADESFTVYDHPRIVIFQRR